LRRSSEKNACARFELTTLQSLELSFVIYKEALDRKYFEVFVRASLSTTTTTTAAAATTIITTT
jgi:hypothetical protein